MAEENPFNLDVGQGAQPSLAPTPIDLLTLTEGQKVAGYLYIKDYAENANPETKRPMMGTCEKQGKSTTFKIWDKGIRHNLSVKDYRGVALLVTGTAGLYNGNMELTINTVDFSNICTDTSLFLKTVNVPVVWDQFITFVNKNFSPKSASIMSELFSLPGVAEFFMSTWAASRYHDAQVGGLMNHTLKMLRLAKTLIFNDERLGVWSDILYLGIVFHDIGKIHEITPGGVYTADSFISHRLLGVELTYQIKDKIIAAYDSSFYYHLIAIQVGHHGEHADKPVTVWAFVVHLIDMLESQLTQILDKIDVLDYKIRGENKLMEINQEKLILGRADNI